MEEMRFIGKFLIISPNCPDVELFSTSNKLSLEKLPYLVGKLECQEIKLFLSDLEIGRLLEQHLWLNRMTLEDYDPWSTAVNANQQKYNQLQQQEIQLNYPYCEIEFKIDNHQNEAVYGYEKWHCLMQLKVKIPGDFSDDPPTRMRISLYS